MKCTKCRTPMTVELLESTPVHSCAKCSGMWLPKGSLAFLKKTARDIPNADFSLKQSSAVLVDYPACESPSRLVRMPFAEGKDLEVEYCKRCEGLYLDSGELSQAKSLLDRVEKARPNALPLGRTGKRRPGEIEELRAKIGLTGNDGWVFLLLLAAIFVIDYRFLNRMISGLIRKVPIDSGPDGTPTLGEFAILMSGPYLFAALYFAFWRFYYTLITVVVMGFAVALLRGIFQMFARELGKK